MQRLLIWVFILGFKVLFAQDAKKSILVKTIDDKIEIDGRLDEAWWEQADVAKDFWQWFPTDSILAKYQTEIYMLRDNLNLYVGVICHTAGDDFITPTLKRDYRAPGNDNISLVFDTFNDNTNAFLIGMNAHGVKREALISNGGTGRGDFSTSWDNRWDGAVTRQEKSYTCEFSIPFSTLRYNSGIKKWQFNSYRFDPQGNERTTWNHVPRNQRMWGTAYMGDMIFEDPPTSTGPNITIIPYVTGGINKDFVEAQPTDFTGNVGTDAKVSVTPGLNLDLTVNPDFSQVEVDEQITNLTRFEISLPERRQFFTENADLFGSFGNRSANPFFSRRIGVGEDVNTGLSIQNPILYGARLSGKITNPLRVGLLNMQTAKVDRSGLPSTNYTVAVLQQKLFSRSNIGFIFVNKQAFGNEVKGAEDEFNRVFGIDYNLASEDNTWKGKIFYHHSFMPEQKFNNQSYAHGTSLTLTKRPIRLTWAHDKIGDNYEALVGFVPRKNFFRISPEVQITFYPKKGNINEHGPGIEWTSFWKKDLGLSDQKVEYFWEFSFLNTQSLQVNYNREYIFLTDSFDPSRSDAEELPGNSEYRFSNFELQYSSDYRNPFAFRLNAQAGGFFNGRLYSLRGSARVRFQPYATVEMDFSLNRVKLPKPYATANILLAGPRIDVTFSRKVFLTTFFQYNDQLDNINLNARFQYRFRPVSDFFLVYTDNYYTNLKGKDRAIIAKFTYWLNI